MDGRFAPCPTCGQYSHSLGEDAVAEAFMHFQTMIVPEHKSWACWHAFDDKTRDAAQVLMAEIERLRRDKG